MPFSLSQKEIICGKSEHRINQKRQAMAGKVPR
jgi:hypothetical protein